VRLARRDERELHDLAHLFGVSTSYVAADEATRHADPEVLLGILRALGVEVHAAKDAGVALRAKRRELAHRIMEPVVVLRGDQPTEIVVTLPEKAETTSLWLTFDFEDGTTRHDRLVESAATLHSTIDVEGERFHQFRIQLAKHGVNVPFGYHTLSLETGTPSHTSSFSSSLLICSPRCPQPSRGWGVFMPLHALRTDHDWGIGSYRDLADLGEWARVHGASMMGGLPLYPAYLDPPIDPSPYRSVSRLAYNEIYIDPEALPELEQSDLARELMNSAAFRARLDASRAQPTVDYEEVARLRREILEPMAETLLSGESRRRHEFERFLTQRPELVAYAEFRAAVERRGRSDALASPPSSLHSFADDPITHYHAYCQWVAAQQLNAAANALPLYADVPVGVHPEGFDPYWSPTSFVPELSGGSPPDLFFEAGQNWAFAPLHPERMRDDHYGYLRAGFARAFRHASYVRIDHVMGLQRLFVMPEGRDATQGAYLSYRADELHALVSLEAYRAGASVVGEDLGTVPEGVRERMARDGMLRSWVFEFESTLDDPLPEPPREVLASLATHDMSRFSSFLWGHDIDESEKLDRLSSRDADDARAQRALYREALFGALEIPVLSEPQLTEAAREGCLAHLGASDALLVLIDLEELWGETEPQNRPGTTEGNWRQRSALTLEEIRAATRIGAELDTINRLRRGAA
jgi:4-alpha-glucanotransferase